MMNFADNIHIQRIREITKNPPISIEEANARHQDHFAEDYFELDFMHDQVTKDLYVYQANNNNSHPGHELAADLSVIGHLTAHSGCQFEGMNLKVTKWKIQIFALK